MAVKTGRLKPGTRSHRAHKLGGEFHTSGCVVRTLVEMLEPCQSMGGGRIYGPACGSGGMFTQAERFVDAHGRHRMVHSLVSRESKPNPRWVPNANFSTHVRRSKNRLIGIPPQKDGLR